MIQDSVTGLKEQEQAKGNASIKNRNQIQAKTTELGSDQKKYSPGKKAIEKNMQQEKKKMEKFLSNE